MRSRYKFIRSIFVIYFLAATTGTLYSQSISSQMLGTTGGHLKGETTALSFGAGEVVVGSFEGETVKLIQGFSNNYDQIPVSVESQPDLPAKFTLYQNYPNPFNPSTTILFDLPHSASVKITIYNYLGMKIRDVDMGEVTAGTHRFEFDGSTLASGVYFYRLQANGAIKATKKMTLIK